MGQFIILASFAFVFNNNRVKTTTILALIFRKYLNTGFPTFNGHGFFIVKKKIGRLILLFTITI
jgi:hypothetical protein